MRVVKQAWFRLGVLMGMATIPLVLPGGLALAQQTPSAPNQLSNPGAQQAGVSTSGAGFANLYQLGEYILYGVFGFAGMVTIAALIWNGYKLALSGANPQSRQQAIHGLMYAGVGALISFGAWSLAGTLGSIAQRM